MNFFGLSFLLFILKWSAGKGFSYTSQKGTFYSILRGSILGPLIFNVFLWGYSITWKALQYPVMLITPHLTVLTKLIMKKQVKTSTKLEVLFHKCVQRKRTLMKAFVIYQFVYCPFVCMFHSKTLNNNIHFSHGRALRS